MSAMLAYMSVPDAYGVVEPGVYRAKAAAAPNLPFLLHLRLRTLLYLSPDPLLPSVSAFLDKCATRFIHLGLRVWKPYATWKPVSEELIKDALEIVLDVNTHPIMVMCSFKLFTYGNGSPRDLLEISCESETRNSLIGRLAGKYSRSGIHQTGTVVGCLRRLQKWNLTSLLEEYRRYAGSKARYANEQFMELFDEDLVTLPKDLPTWFIDQRRMMEEEEAEFRKSLESSKDKVDDAACTSLSVLEASSIGLASPDLPRQGTEETKSKQSTGASGGNGTVESNFWSVYYLRSSPLTTESRSYKRKIIGKVE